MTFNTTDSKKGHLQFFSSPCFEKYSKCKRQPTIFLMNNHPSNKNKRVDVKPPRNIEVGRQHDESISIMISEVNANHNSNNHPSNNNKRVVLKPRNSDNNKDNGCSYKIVCLRI